MFQTKQQIIAEIINHFQGMSYQNSYVGITSDARTRLFRDHQVSQENGHYISRLATSDTIAREIEAYFLALGMDGGPGGGDRTSRIVYAYAKTFYTNP